DAFGSSGCTMTATRVTLGAISLSNSTHLPPIPGSKLENPVTLPPGLAKLSTKPSPTGSAHIANTIGTVWVCSNTAFVSGVSLTRITSGFKATSSTAAASPRNPYCCYASVHGSECYGPPSSPALQAVAQTSGSVTHHQRARRSAAPDRVAERVPAAAAQQSP